MRWSNKGGISQYKAVLTRLRDKLKFTQANNKSSKRIMQQYLEDSDRDIIFQNLKAAPENKKCIDCSKKNPSWASVYLGLFLCYDCAGKHRQYGVQYTFVRSLDYDKWTKRQIAFMEIGGNAKAMEFFTKHGLVAPIDYKSPIVAKYKNDQTKKVDNMLATSDSHARIEKPVFVSQKEEEHSQKPIESTIAHTKPIETKTTEQTENANPFNTVKIDKDQTKTKGFSVEFTKSKTISSNTKNRVSARKIDNIDLDSLTLQEDVNSFFADNNSMTSTEPAINRTSLVADTKEDDAAPKSEPAKPSFVSDEDRLKKFKSAKSISSSAFRDNENQDPNMDMKRFSNATSISSSQFFGDQNESKIDYQQKIENAKEFLTNVGGKVGAVSSVVGEKVSAVGSVVSEKFKEKAGSIGTIFTKINTKWQDRNKNLEKK